MKSFGHSDENCSKISILVPTVRVLKKPPMVLKENGKPPSNEIPSTNIPIPTMQKPVATHESEGDWTKVQIKYKKKKK